MMARNLLVAARIAPLSVDAETETTVRIAAIPAFLDEQHWIDYSKGVNLTADAGQTSKKAATTIPGQTISDVELVTATPSAAFVIAPGLFASETTDWGAHWRAVPLPDIYPTYRGFSGVGGWS